MVNNLYPCLWYNGQAGEAARFYCSIFKNSGIMTDTPMVVIFEINGQKFMGLNGGPAFSFNESVSFVIDCKDQEEVDHYWNALLADGGKESMCGWLKDKYGMSWQVVPVMLGELMSKGEPAKSNAMMQALLKMKKPDVDRLQSAYDAA